MEDSHRLPAADDHHLGTLPRALTYHPRRMLPEKTFENRVGIITGGGTGIGFAIARELAKLGATVVIASRSEEHLGPAVEQLRSETGRANAPGFCARDVCDAEAVGAMAGKGHACDGRDDFLVKNAA